MTFKKIMIKNTLNALYIGFESESGTASGIPESLGLDFKTQAIRLTESYLWKVFLKDTYFLVGEGHILG